ncbi:MAG TPA: hypothetical protein VLF40_03125 [Candidatus Saccharimonadales bacterium]|nr:hypothetical protein [Candidatus Saccharimonadales bacterium]
MPRARRDTRRERTRYECRVTRSLAPNQEDLARPLGLLAANTSNYVEYDELGKVGVTIMMLEPILRRILTPNRRGVISRDSLQQFETELKDDLSHAQYADYNIPLDIFNPLALYGSDKNWLALQFSPKDYRMVGDRAVVEAYMRDNYVQANGRPVSKRFIDGNSRRLRPHATVGEVHYENMAPEQVGQFQADPTGFLVREAYARMARNQEQYGSACGVEEIIWPETVGLNGLKVFCQQKQ